MWCVSFSPDSLFIEVEREFELLGITAVEDRLQDLVPECIAYFLQASTSCRFAAAACATARFSRLLAGIRFVMITGDKLGTAENIARATRLITRDMTVVHLADGAFCPHERFALFLPFAAAAADGGAADELLRQAESRAREAARLAIVVDGATLKFLLKPALGLSDRFYALLFHAAAVVCCRTNPRQKVCFDFVVVSRAR